MSPGDISWSNQHIPRLHSGFITLSLPLPAVAPPGMEADVSLTADDIALGFSIFLTGGYVEALEVTKETPSPSTIRSNSSSEKTYDDVGCSRENL